MIDPSKFVEECKTTGVDFFVGVPDSLLKSFCAYITDNCGANHVIAANEGGAVGLAAGHYLATGKPALVYMQNSGQGNAVNPLASLADPDVYSIPMVLLVGWRGQPGVKDEPQHIKQGKVTISLFEALGIPTKVLPDDEEAALEMTHRMAQRAKAESRPVAMVVHKGLFEEYNLQNRKPNIATLRREDAIQTILESIGEEAVVVSTTGMISREVYEIRERLGQDHSRDFLTVGSMGHTIMIAMGIAKAQPNRKVCCIDGDGASIMHLGNMAIVGQSGCGNLIHIVLNNAAHDSVGGQPTVAGDIKLGMIARGCGYDVKSELTPITVRCLREDARLWIKQALSYANVPQYNSSIKRPVFLEVQVAKGARNDLGRPKEPPKVNKNLYMETLGAYV